jgi:serine/threonine protein kinase
MTSITEVLERAGVEVEQLEIGGGGSAIVHQARVVRSADGLPEAGAKVAVKEYRSSLLAVPGQLNRIRQEAALGQQIRHPNVVQTYRLYEPKDGEIAPTVLLLEWIEGRTLDSWYSDQPRPVRWETVRAIC